MVQINSEFTIRNHRRQLLLGGMMLLLSLICIAMTAMFIYVSNEANQRVENIREEYRQVSDRREARVAELTERLADLQLKIDGIVVREKARPAKRSSERQGSSDEYYPSDRGMATAAAVVNPKEGEYHERTTER